MSNTSDEEQYIENLTQIAVTPNHPGLFRLSVMEVRTVNAARLELARLFLCLAVKLEAGVKPQMPTRTE
jgi:hypothetical protein